MKLVITLLALIRHFSSLCAVKATVRLHSQVISKLSFHPEEKTASIAREQVILLSQKI